VSFKELVGGLLDVAIPTFGETIDYRPNAGGSFSIEAVFDRSFEQIDPDTEEVIASNVPMLGIKLANLPFSPDRGDEVRIGRERFQVIDSQEDGQGGARLILNRTYPE